jgi:hypothetical protein
MNMAPGRITGSSSEDPAARSTRATRRIVAGGGVGDGTSRVTATSASGWPASGARPSCIASHTSGPWWPSPAGQRSANSTPRAARTAGSIPDSTDSTGEQIRGEPGGERIQVADGRPGSQQARRAAIPRQRDEPVMNAGNFGRLPASSPHCSRDPAFAELEPATTHV